MSNKKVIIILLVCLISFFSLGLRAASESPALGYNISGYVSDNSSGFVLSNVLVKATNENTAVENTTVTDSSGYYIISGLPDGIYDFSYTKVGYNTGSSKITISGTDITNANITLSDTTPPTITISSPSNNALLNTSTVAVSGTASDSGSGLQKVEVSVDSDGFSPATVTGTLWSFTKSNLSDEPHTITAKATDNAGNSAETSISISVDASPPVINIISPADGSALTASSVTIIGTASDNSLSKVEVKVGTGDWQPASGTNSWSATVTLSEGSNTIYAQATDTSGNIQQTSITVTVVSVPSIDNVRALIISNSSIKIVWATNQSDMNRVMYGYKPGLEDGIWSSWNNNTSNPDIPIDGLIGQPVYYQVFSYNASNSSAYSNSSIFKFVYPLQVTLYYVEPTIINDNETWLPAARGHIGKFIGIDGYFNNTGDDTLSLTIYNENLCPKFCSVTLNKNENKSFRDISVLGRYDFEIKPAEVKWQDESHGFFNSTLQINVSGQNGSWAFSYTNTSTTNLTIIPIFKIKRAMDRDGKDLGRGTVLVSAGSTTTVKYILEANSSVNLTNVQICDPYYPEDQRGPCFNILHRLEANKPQNVSYTYTATTSDLSSMKCDASRILGIPCIINQVTFGADVESTGEHIKDTEYLELWVGTIPPPTYTSSSGGGGGGGGGAPASSEDFNNIEAREVREMDVYAKSASTYVFKSAYPVMVVAFESSSSESAVPVVVEVLKNRSKFIGDNAPGKPYKYFNVFVGTSGFSNKVSKGVIAYRVNNSWFKENNIDPAEISLYKWRGTWVKLDTQIAENRSNYTYYASLTGNFSSFAIVAAKDQKMGGAYVSLPDNISVAPVEQQNTTQAIANLSGDSPQHKIPGLSAAAVLVFVIAGVIFYLKKNHKKFNRDVRK